MKKQSRLIIIMIFAFLLTSCGVSSTGNNDQGNFGPTEWLQFRMNENNNPVFENGNKDSVISDIFRTASEVRSTPVIVNNSLYVGNHETGNLYAFDIRTGEVLWENQALNWVHSEMIYYQDMVFVGYGNRFSDNGWKTRGTGDSGVLALDANTGYVLWQFDTPGEVMPTPLIKEDKLYAVTGDRHLYCISLEDGHMLWKLNLGSFVSMSSPTIKNDILFVGGAKPYKFFAIDVNKKQVLWEVHFSEAFAGLDDVPPVIYKDKYVITTLLEGDSTKPVHKIYALDLVTGEIVWEDSWEGGQNVKNNKSGAPIVYNDQVFVSSPITRTFYSYNANNGEKIWEYEIDNISKAPPVAKDNLVYFVDTGGFVYAFDVVSGELQGKIKLEGKLAPAGPVIINDYLIVGSQDGNVYSVPLTEFSSE